MAARRASTLDVLVSVVSVCNSTLDEKLDFLAHLFDLSGGGGLSRAELGMLYMSGVIALARLFVPHARGLMTSTGLQLTPLALARFELFAEECFDWVR